MRLRLSLQFFATLLSIAAFASPSFAAAPDAGLETQYEFSNDLTSVTWIVCGYLPGSDGCYGSGSFGPFGHVGAILEGYTATNGNSVQRAVYIVDVAAGSSGKDVILYRYLKTDTVTDGSYDTITTELTHQVTLPLVGGSDVRCSMAANSSFIVIGTDQSTSAVMVTKGSYKLQSIGGFSNAPTVTSITTDGYGYISVTFGGGAVIPGFVIVGPAGNFEFDGGGVAYLASTTNGLSTKDVAVFGDSAAAKLAARPVTPHATH
jgi:hypothetical protein